MAWAELQKMCRGALTLSGVTPATANLVGCFQSRKYGVGRDWTRFVVERFAFGACCLGNQLQLLVVRVTDADVGQRGWQSNRFAEAVDLVDQLTGSISKKQPDLHADGDLPR